MESRKRLFLAVGVVLTVLLCVGGYFLLRPAGSTATATTNATSSSAPTSANALTPISCIGGSEKGDLMADPKVLSILRDKYHLDVKFAQMGSYDMVRLTTDQLAKQGINCLWPASTSALSVYLQSHPKPFNTATALKTPEVIYSGPESTKALVAAKIVQLRGNQYYIVDLKSLLLNYILAGKTWKTDLHTADDFGPVKMSSTDPAKSNSGFTLSQLELTILSTDNVYSPPSETQAHKGLSVVRQLYDAQGYLDSGSADGFNLWLQDGGELHAPLYASYENLAIQQLAKYKGNKAVTDELKASIRILYPEPTIFNDNPIIALTPDAQKFIDAMLSPDIQDIAWKSYGFRSGTTIGANNVADFADLQLAQQLRSTNPPNAAVTNLLLDCLQQSKCS